jgi:hypothetical protein
MEKEHLFIFGYEDPSERRSNAEHGTDFESSAAVKIVAPDAAKALEWGREIAERFVATLYEDATVSWKAGNFAAWIEKDPDEHLRGQWDSIPVVRLEEHPSPERLAPKTRA